MHIKKEESTEADESDDDVLLSDYNNDEDQNNDGLTSYEMERLANIKKNEMFFKELKMDEVITYIL